MNESDLQWMGVGVLIAIAVYVLTRHCMAWVRGQSAGCSHCPSSALDASNRGVTHSFVPIEDLDVIDRESANAQ